MYVRFGLYRETLSLPDISSTTVPMFAQSMHYYARCLAAAVVIEDVSLSLQYLESLRVSVGLIPVDTKPISHAFYPYHQEMGHLMLWLGECALNVAYVRRTHDETLSNQLDKYKPLRAGKEGTDLGSRSSNLAVSEVSERIMLTFDALHRAIALQDSFKYMEPENFYLPIRQCLAAFHLFVCEVQGLTAVSPDSRWGCNVTAAIHIYREDLQHHPHNVWSEQGLQKALRMLSVGDFIDGVPVVPPGTGSNMDEKSGSCCELGLCNPLSYQ